MVKLDSAKKWLDVEESGTLENAGGVQSKGKEKNSNSKSNGNGNRKRKKDRREMEICLAE